MKKQKRSFKKLKEEMAMAPEKFDELCRKISQEYAKSELQFSRRYFTNYYNISQDCFYKILEYAIVKSLVSEEDAYSMRKKAIQNQKVRYPNAYASSVYHYQDILKKRYEYSLKLLSNEKIKQIAEQFVLNQEESNKKISEKLNVEWGTIELAIAKAMKEDIVDKKTKAKLYEYFLSNFSEEKIKEIAETFARSTLSKQEIAKNFEIDSVTLDLALKKAIVENIISDEDFEKIRNRSISGLEKEKLQKANEIFDEMLRLKKLKT